MKGSWEGYLAGLHFRGRLSLLVEGKDDRTFMAFLVRQCPAGKAAGKEIVIDVVGALSGFQDVPGMRDRVEFVARQAGNDAQIVSKDMFRAAVDREFRSFSTMPPLRDDISGCHVDGLVHWTRGHSIENYVLSDLALCECIETLYCEHVGHDALDQLRSHYTSLVVHSASLSLACMHRRLLERAETAFDPSVWQLNTSRGQYEINQSQVVSLLKKRGVDAQVAADVCSVYASISIDAARIGKDVRWFGHGKLTLNLLWAGVSALLRNHNVSPDIAVRIGGGDRDDKLRTASKWWASKGAGSASDSPGSLMQWFAGSRLAVE